MYDIMTVENSGADEIQQNYSKMDDTGKEKLRDVAEKVLDIWETVVIYHEVWQNLPLPRKIS